MAIILLLSALAPDRAVAQSEHTVREGQSLARVARRYGLSVSSLAAANGLARDASVRPGQVLQLPERGAHYVSDGETLGEIAHQHGCTVAELSRVNRLRADRPLRVGQRLALPGSDASPVRRRAQERWGTASSPGVATLYRTGLGRRFRVRLVERSGRVRRAALTRLRELMRPHNARRAGPPPPRRLLEILARISDHFGGRTITIVSGYRSPGGYTRETSQHTRGHALDLRVQGVPNTVVRDYVRGTFRRVGVGYYPRSTFVHVDVRERDTYWVDWSGPGEAPRYERRGERAEDTENEHEESGEGAAAAAEDDGRDPDDAQLEESE